MLAESTGLEQAATRRRAPEPLRVGPGDKGDGGDALYSFLSVYDRT